MKFLINIFLILLLCVSSNLLCAQSPISKDAQAARIRMKGVYIYQFARRVYWPEKYTKGDFNIGIYGNRDIFVQLSSSYTDQLVGSQAIKFKYFDKPSEIEDCHLLYVINENKDIIAAINKSLAQQTVLVSEANDLVSSGSMFNFIYVKSRLKYQINKTKAEKSGFKIDQTLTKFAYSTI